MDPKLAEIYGTNQVSEEELEKAAAAELAESLAGGEGADITEDDLEAMAQEVLEGAGVEGEPQGDPEDEAKEKLSEADYLGRVMAHAYVQELREIDKTAASAGFGHGMTETAKNDALARILKNKDEVGKDNGLHAKGTAADLEAAHSGARNRAHSEALGMRSGPTGMKRVGNLLAGGREGNFHGGNGKDFAGRAGNHLVAAFKQRNTGPVGKSVFREALKSTGARAGAAGLLGAGALAAHQMTKKSSAMDTLVEARALEMLEEAGLSPEQLIPAEQEKVSGDPRDILAAEVEARATELLNQFAIDG